MQPAAHRLLTPGVPLDAGEESLQEEPPADLHRYHHLQWTRVLLPERWVIYNRGSGVFTICCYILNTQHPSLSRKQINRIEAFMVIDLLLLWLCVKKEKFCVKFGDVR